jgi:putative lipoic acid-binding regulatory protein
MKLPKRRIEEVLGDAELKLDYPCRWTYQVMGRDEDRLRAAVSEVIGDAPHAVEPGNRTSGGRWVSVHVEVLVEDEAQRHGTFDALRAHPDVRMVL